MPEKQQNHSTKAEMLPNCSQPRRIAYPKTYLLSHIFMKVRRLMPVPERKQNHSTSASILPIQCSICQNPRIGFGQRVCRLPMLIALFASFLCLASLIAMMYISSPFPIDPRCSRQAMQSHCNNRSSKIHRLRSRWSRPRPQQRQQFYVLHTVL